MERRNFLRKTTVLTAGIAGLAGCGSPADGTETDDGLIDGTETDGGIGDDETETDDGMGTESDIFDLDEMDGETPDNVQISNTQLQRSDGNAVVTGTIENTGDQSIDEAEVAVTLLDDNDELIGQYFHNTEEAEMESLDAGASWDFSVTFPYEDLEDAAGYRIDVDTDVNQAVDWDLDFGSDTETSNG